MSVMLQHCSLFLSQLVEVSVLESGLHSLYVLGECRGCVCHCSTRFGTLRRRAGVSLARGLEAGSGSPDEKSQDKTLSSKEQLLSRARLSLPVAGN